MTTTRPATRRLPELAGVTHRQVRVGDLSVHVAEAGEGEPVVLLHGWPQHWWVWRHLVPLLSPAAPDSPQEQGRTGEQGGSREQGGPGEQPPYRLVMPDLRGSGWSDAPATGYDKEQLASDLLGLLDVLELPRVGLVGHDWGGWAGFLACLRAPERFRGLVALGIPHPFQAVDRRVLEAWRTTYQLVLGAPVLGQRLLRASPQVVERVLRAGAVRQDAFTAEDLRLFSAPLQEPARARASSALYRTFVLREGLPVALGRYRDQRLTVPTRLLVGEADPVASGRLLAGWEPYADDMRLEVLPSCGHFVPEEQPAAVAAAVRALLG
jgi:pimeloyl-ACP methyl ester carboxylesterase